MRESKLSKLQEFLREYGWADTLARLATRGALGLFPGGFHRRLAPLLGELVEHSLSVHHSAADLLRRYFIPDHEDRLQDLLCEAAALKQELDTRYANRRCAYPPAYAVHGESSLLLYALVRLLQPRNVLETGVANGHSSFYLLNAMAANRSGRLHSVEIATDVGALLDPAEKERWQLHVLDRRHKRKSFERVLEGLPELDVFLRDSDYSYQWVAFELEAARTKLAHLQLLAVNDAEKSYGFLDFCASHAVKPVLLFDGGKVLGLTGPWILDAPRPKPPSGGPACTGGD